MEILCADSIRSSTPAATLINGLGRFNNGPASPLAVINVVSGTRYRFRLVSISCAPNFEFSIDSHALSVIEADSVCLIFFASTTADNFLSRSM